MANSGIAVWVPDPAVITAILTQTYATADATIGAQTAAAVTTTAATNVTPYGFSTAAQADAIRTNLNALRADHLDLAQFVNSIVDHLQTLGLVD